MDGIICSSRRWMIDFVIVRKRISELWPWLGHRNAVTADRPGRPKLRMSDRRPSQQDLQLTPQAEVLLRETQSPSGPCSTPLA